ncbi:Periplasmic copper-binding protein (NosD) [uncultured archaeon]|nr:Periplasmic copper-binding protein (NosD) [uncultured archaeon]
MKLLAIVFIVVMLLASARSNDLNDGSNHGIWHNEISLGDTNSLNSSLPYRAYNFEKSEGVLLKEVALNFKNNSNLSIGPEITRIKLSKINISEEPPYRMRNLNITLTNKSSNPTWASSISIIQPINSIPAAIDNSENGLLNSTIIIVHADESIQAAINAANSGDIIEITNGIYYENLHINKALTIRGKGLGKELPVIDANGIGNAIEISADQVILEKIISTNSSKSSMTPGAGIRFSSSNNCSISGIISHGNYYGIALVDSNNNTISGSNISDDHCGVRFYFSNNNILQNNEVKKTLNPLDIVSSEGNIIQGNVFESNSHKVETSNENEIIDNRDTFSADDNERTEFVELNAKPHTFQSDSDVGSKKSKSSDSDDYATEWHPRVVPIDNGQKYEKLAQKAASTLVFNPPKVMTSEISEWVDARIGLENTTGLVQGLLGKGDVQFRNINANMNMTYVVKLEGDSGFEILAKRPDAQVLGIDILRNGYG